MTAAGPAVVVRDLQHRYGNRPALSGIGFEVAAGETFGLIGPDGAGKTTTLLSVLGLIAPSAGTLETCGLAPRRQRRELSKRVGYLAQRFSLYGDLSIDENLAFFGRIHGASGWQRRRDELLEMLRLGPFRGRLADRLSGGMRQKLALACTLIHTPELLVLDEPTTGVDPVSRREFWKILAALQRRGLTLVVTTPYLDEAERCSRVGMLHRGRLLTVEEPGRLRRALPGVLLEVLARPKRRALEILRERGTVGEIEVFGERLHAHLPAVSTGDAAVAAEGVAADLRAAGLEVQSVRRVAPSLEDVFLSMMRAAAGAAAGEGQA